MQEIYDCSADRASTELVWTRYDPTEGAQADDYVTYSGLMAGPVRIVSTDPIMSSQRILGWQSFEEIIGASLAS